METYAQFIENNPSFGALKIQAFRGDLALPTENIRITVFKNFADGPYTFFEGVTDENGIIDDILLPSPPARNSLEAENPNKDAEYLFRATLDSFVPFDTVVSIFESVRTIQPVRLLLKVSE